MKFKKRSIIFLTAAALFFLVPYIIFLSRPPVIIVADMASILLCGKDRIQKETRRTAFALFRPVKTVIVADDADPDIIPFAVAEASVNPYCVLFPLRFASSARLYRENYPGIPVVVLEGRYSQDRNPARDILGGSGDYFIYKSGIDDDFYTAGLAASVLSSKSEGSGRIVVFLDQAIQRQGREAFLRAVNTMENPPETVILTSFSQFSEIPDITCAVLAGIGFEFIEINPDLPVIVFTWMDPDLLPSEAVLVFDDTPWAQAENAVRLAYSGVPEGQIHSKIIIKNPKKISRRALRKIHN